MTFGLRLKNARKNKNLTQRQLAELIQAKHNSISNWENDQNRPDMDTVELICGVLDVSPTYLLSGYEYDKKSQLKMYEPTITEDFETFPIIGEIAAGYDRYATTNWDDGTISIPKEHLRGRDKSEFFVLKIVGDSMYPTYHNGDKVLILKQNTVNYSGDVGAVLYNDEIATLKKVEFVKGEDWINLVPINPNVPPIRIEGEDLEHCHIMGIPKLLIREIN